MKEIRKLTAVMFTDIAGYTTLMSKDEQKAMTLLQKNREVQKSLAEKHNGEFLKEMGDGTLLCYQSALDAVRCAMEIQESVKDDADLNLRIGIHLGDIVFKEGDVFGDGVNVASRIEALAEAGGICISEEVYRSVRNQPDIHTDFAGERHLKNVDHPVKTYKIVESGTIEKRKNDLTDSSESTKKSIAVLPFINISADPEQDYFCDGMTEEIINALTHIENLKVIARTSAFMFKGKNEDMRAIGKKLDVEHLLEGSVRKAGNTLRITAQLIKVSDGSHLWSEKYDRELEDVFEIQDEISLAIVDKLKVNLIGKERQKIEKKGTVNVEAYNNYLLGQHHLQFWTQDDANNSIEYFKKALTMSPNYAAAYAGISSAYIQLGSDHGNLTPKEAFPIAKEHISKALHIDGNLAEAHLTNADIMREYDWDWKKAELYYKKALELKPGNLFAHLHYAVFLSLFNRHKECKHHLELSYEIDPVSYISNNMGGWLYYFIGENDKAIESLQKAAKMAPNLFITYSGLGSVFYELNDLQKTYEMAVKCETVDTKLPSQLGQSAALYALSGHEEKANKILNKLLKTVDENHVTRLVLPLVYAALRDNDNAFYWLNNAIKEKLRVILFIKTPWFRHLRDDQRFESLLKELGMGKL
ncbi:hypothetical protein KAR48_19655 [bacterium]|nr:hypothetical protein [bacterium]